MKRDVRLVVSGAPRDREKVVSDSDGVARKLVKSVNAGDDWSGSNGWIYN